MLVVTVTQAAAGDASLFIFPAESQGGFRTLTCITLPMYSASIFLIKQPLLESVFIVLRGFEHLLKKLNMKWMVMATNAGGRQSRD